jgi:hypothetical protein
MVDPTSDLNEDITAEEAPTCGTCGSAITNSADHRVLTWIDDGEVQAVHFCDDACKADWDEN